MKWDWGNIRQSTGSDKHFAFLYCQPASWSRSRIPFSYFSPRETFFKWSCFSNIPLVFASPRGDDNCFWDFSRPTIVISLLLLIPASCIWLMETHNILPAEKSFNCGMLHWTPNLHLKALIYRCNLWMGTRVYQCTDMQQSCCPTLFHIKEAARPRGKS